MQKLVEEAHGDDQPTGATCHSRPAALWEHWPVTVAIDDSGATARSRLRAITTSRAVPHPAVLGLAALTAAWTITFAVLVVRRHHGFWDVGFDMGIHDQSIWLLAHAHEFMTVRGLDVFGHHASPGYFLVVPAYWLGAGPDFLNVFQVVSLALGVIPLYLLARDRRLSPWVAATLAAGFLLHPATQFFTWELFHPEVVAITPLLCAYLCATRQSWKWFAFWVVLAISWKEDIALAVMMLGLLIALRGNRRIGLVTAAASLAWFLVWAVILFPAINGGHVQSEGIYSGVGGSAGGMVETLFNNPGAITSHVFSSESGDFAWRLFAPFGFVPVLAPLVLLIGLPQFLLNVLTDVGWTRVIEHHYAALCIGALAMASVEGVAFARRRLGKVATLVAVGLVASGAGFGTLAWGPSPLSAKYENGWWPPAIDPRIDALRATIAAVTNDGAVSAVYGLVPQLSQREEIYEFPNPWRSRNFGIEGEPRRNPRRVEWLVIDRTVLDAEAAGLLQSILGHGHFTIVYQGPDLLVAHRPMNAKEAVSGRQ
ncbi:MAG: DUF2079 domain-containing protein [Acidimicrobiia bacterium]|nr:DUF2079 domain-containing protein [Acidimicrobiia bacterium]